jgi:hypothetical protein
LIGINGRFPPKVSASGMAAIDTFLPLDIASMKGDEDEPRWEEPLRRIARPKVAEPD